MTDDERFAVRQERTAPLVEDLHLVAHLLRLAAAEQLGACDILVSFTTASTSVDEEAGWAVFDADILPLVPPAHAAIVPCILFRG